MPAVDPVNAEEGDYLDIDVLKPARSSRVCLTCQYFRYLSSEDQDAWSAQGSWAPSNKPSLT